MKRSHILSFIIQALITETHPHTQKALIDARDFWDMLEEDNKDIRGD